MANKHNTQNPRLCALRVADPPAFVKEVIIAIEKCQGVISNASAMLNVERRTLFMWLEDYPQLKKATTTARKARIEETPQTAASQRASDLRVRRNAEPESKPRKRKKKAA